MFLDEAKDSFDMNDIFHIFPMISPFNVVHTAVVDTTQHFLMEYEGPTANTVCVADEQFLGRGIYFFPIPILARSNRRWDFPLGCLMFSVKLPIQQNSQSEMIPHICTLSLILALESIPEFCVI